jgi:PKD repeat protein
VTPNGTPPLVYHGGPIQTVSKVYTLFWVPPGYYLSAAYKAQINQYFQDVAFDSFKVSNVYAAGTQYYQCTLSGGVCAGAKTFERYNVVYGGTATVTTAFPTSGNCPNYTLGSGATSRACLFDSQLRTQIKSTVGSLHWTRGLGTEVFLFTPPGVASCFTGGTVGGGDCFDPSGANGFCAYHSFDNAATTATTDDYVYANQPFADINGCVMSAIGYNAYPNDDGADPTISVVSHEQNETMTDPELNAWYDSHGFENGDECAWTSLGTVSNNGVGDYDQVIHGDQYLMQTEWSDRAHDCVKSNTLAQGITANFTVSPSSPVHGSSATFTSTTGGTYNGTKAYSWNFGDGGTSALANPTHTYATAGTKTVTLIVTDMADGDAARVIHSVVVT